MWKSFKESGNEKKIKGRLIKVEKRDKEEQRM